MGWVVLAVSMVFFLIVGDIDMQQRQTIDATTQRQAGQMYADQMLMIANRVNDWRYQTGHQDGAIPPEQLALPFTPDNRIQYQLWQGRLWIWMPEQPGLLNALRMRSRGSALIGTLQGSQLVWLSGMATGLIPPPGAPDGAVVYLN